MFLSPGRLMPSTTRALMRRFPLLLQLLLLHPLSSSILPSTNLQMVLRCPRCRWLPCCSSLPSSQSFLSRLRLPNRPAASARRHAAPREKGPSGRNASPALRSPTKTVSVLAATDPTTTSLDLLQNSFFSAWHAAVRLSLSKSAASREGKRFLQMLKGATLR